MYKVEILSDRLENEAISRRRRLDQERKERIFNPKVDVNALDEQIKTKHSIATIEKKRNDAIDHQANLNDEILALMDEKVDKARRHQLEEINEFRKTQQQAHHRREYDLYDPKHLRKDMPARVGDFDPRSGVSSLQKFQGEDLDHENRHMLQKQQMKYWVEEQVYEKERIKQELSNEKSQYDKFQTAINHKMNALQHAVDKAKRDQAKNDYEYNTALHDEKKRREELQKLHDSDLSNGELIIGLNGMFLSENSSTSSISNNGAKVRVDLFKGFTEHQKQQIRQDQHEQRQDNIAASALKAQQAKEWTMRDNANNRTIELLEREKSRKAKEIAIEIQRENAATAVQDKKRYTRQTHPETPS